MPKRIAIPADTKEYPDWEYRPYPKYLGTNNAGVGIQAKDEKHHAELLELHPELDKSAKKAEPEAEPTDEGDGTVFEETAPKSNKKR